MTLEERVAQLEREVAELKGQVSERPKPIKITLNGTFNHHDFLKKAQELDPVKP